MEGKVFWLDEMEMDEGPDWPSDNFCLFQMEFSVRPCHLLFLRELSKWTHLFFSPECSSRYYNGKTCTEGGGGGSQSIWLQTTLIVYIDKLRHSKRWELLCAHWGKSVWYSVWLSAESPSVSYHLLWASDREIEEMRWLSDCFLAQEARESKIIPDMVLNGNATKRWIHLMLKYIYLL